MAPPQKHRNKHTPPTPAVDNTPTDIRAYYTIDLDFESTVPAISTPRYKLTDNQLRDSTEYFSATKPKHDWVVKGLTMFNDALQNTLGPDKESALANWDAHMLSMPTYGATGELTKSSAGSRNYFAMAFRGLLGDHEKESAYHYTADELVGMVFAGEDCKRVWDGEEGAIWTGASRDIDVYAGLGALGRSGDGLGIHLG